MQAWDDVGDCWCTTSESGRAQLAVRVSIEVYPTEVTIEHIPQAATLDIGSAPRRLELWAAVASYDDWARVYDAATVRMGAQADIKDSALPDTYVRIARWEYDISAPAHVQTHKVDVDLEGLGVPVQELVVRATSNWGGGDHTCFYRVRLGGNLARSALQAKWYRG